jgi:hypothetical protein
MIGTMLSIIAIICGVLLGFYVCQRTVDLLLALAYHYRIKSEVAYLDLYDLMDDEHGFEIVKPHISGLTTYAKYLQLHQMARGKIYELFTKYYAESSRYVLRMLLIFALLPTIIFWQHGLYFLLPFLLIMFGFVYYKRFIKKYDINFYSRIYVITALTEYSKSTENTN